MENSISYDTAAKAATIPSLDARDEQAAHNEAVFAQLRNQHETACRDVEALESALSCAQARGKVLGAAIQQLDAPTQTPPIR